MSWRAGQLPRGILGASRPAPQSMQSPGPSSTMLMTLLVSSILALFGVSTGQAQVPIQANFDAMSLFFKDTS